MVPAEKDKVVHSLTIRITAVLLLLSGGLSVFSLTSAVPLFGHMRSGVIALVYNLAQGASLFWLGYVLWKGHARMVQALLIATVCYTFDKLSFILDSKGRHASMASTSSLLQSLGGGIDTLVDQVSVLVAASFLLSWWIFSWWLYTKRSHFVAAE